MSLFFDASPGYAQQDEEIEPLWLQDLEDEKEVLKWGKRMYDVLQDYYLDRDHMSFESIARYSGKYYKHEPRTDGARLIGSIEKRKNDFPHIVTNHFKSLVDQKVSMQVKYKPQTDIMPDSWGQYQDKTDAEAAKKFLKAAKDFNEAELLWPRFARRTILTGNGYILPTWDKRAGKRKGKKTTKFTLTNRAGITKTFEAPEYHGEIRFRFPLSQHVRLFPADSAANCQGMMVISYPDIWELRTQYPELADEIKSAKDASYFDYNLCDIVNLEQHGMQLEFWLRANDAIPNGMYFKMTPDVLLEKPQDNPVPIPEEARESLALGDLPVVHLMDTEIDGDVNGYPSTMDIFHQQHVYDKMTTHFVMNIAYFCNPKWVVQYNSVNTKQLENIPGLVVEHKGTMEPKLQVVAAITQDQFAMRASILEGMEKTFGVYSVSRGSPPPGTRAAAQLYWYGEQEAELNAPFKRKFDHCVEALDTMTLQLMGKHYTGDKERLVYVLGEDKKWLAESLDVSSLKRRFTVRAKATSDLPDSKYARLNALFELHQLNPTEFTYGQLLEAIDNGQQEKLIDHGRAATIAAERENEEMKAGKDVLPPEMFEYHIEHLAVHYRLVQDAEYKKQDAKTRRIIEEHVGATEALCIAFSMTNPIFQQKLMALPQFPLFAVLPPPNPMAPPPMAPPPQGGGGKPNAKQVGPAAALGLPGDQQQQMQKPSR